MMVKPLVYFNIRVTDDERHCIYVQDFDAFEEFLISYCLRNLDDDVCFSIKFKLVGDDEDEDIPF